MREEEAFEHAIIENPEDVASYSAYSDWLVEHDDPRGEFIAVQLALEDESRSKTERAALKKREKALLKKHEREWLGELAPHLLDKVNVYDTDSYSHDTDQPTMPDTEHHWRRGFLAELKVDCLTVKLAQALADAHAAQFVQKFHVVSTAYYLSMQDDETPRRKRVPQNARGYDEWFELLGAPILKCIRVFQMGDIYGEPSDDGSSNHTYTPGLEKLIAQMPYVEELHLLCKFYDPGVLFKLKNLTNLRVLRMYALGEPYGDPNIPLDVLAKNKALANLTHLFLHPHFAFHQSFIPFSQVAAVFRSKCLKGLTHLTLRLSDMGDDGIRALIDSGMLKQLTWLDLRHGCVTDEGAKLLAACPDARRLERIDLSRNGVTAKGLAAMKKAKIKAVADGPLTQAELDSQEYLHHGDFE